MTPYRRLIAALALPALALAAPASAGDRDNHEAEVRADSPPTLVVAISMDQLSADLFEQYRRFFTGGLARLQDGVVFQNGYQAHAATETCPGHSTILTGRHPANNGIVANGWADFTIARDNKEVYCAEDTARVPNDPAQRYVPSAINLMVPTLGAMLADASPGSQNVAVAGKDRSALMMAGPTADEIYWWTGNGFGPGNTADAGPSASSGGADGINQAIAGVIAAGAGPFNLPEWCAARTTPVVQGARPVGDFRFPLPAGDASAWRASPRLDIATIDLAEALVAERDLGGDETPDVLSIGLAGTDYVGHAFGTNGAEQCIQLAEVDQRLGEFFDGLDARGIDYVVVLTADHGGLDLPERAVLQGQPTARRADPALTPSAMGETIAAELGIDGPALLGQTPFGDVYVDPRLSAEDRAQVIEAALARYSAHGDVEAVFTQTQIMEVAIPSGDPREWSLIERVRTATYPGRSGDLYVALKPGVTPILEPMEYYVATHGSPWDYDRRVPILFWRAGIAQTEQVMPMLTVDIAPTLASLLDLPYLAGDFDGQCRDLIGGAEDSCE